MTEGTSPRFCQIRIVKIMMRSKKFLNQIVYHGRRLAAMTLLENIYLS